MRCGGRSAHTEKYFRNPIKSTRNQILFTIFRLIWNQTDVHLVPNHSENGKCNLIPVYLTRFRKYICVYISRRYWRINYGHKSTVKAPNTSLSFSFILSYSLSLYYLLSYLIIHYIIWYLIFSFICLRIIFPKNY